MSSMQDQQVIVKGSKCEDCGNQAKKDCAHSRCRTCCKNKGYKCQTHVRSTWIPVDRRRHKVEQSPLHTNLHQGDIPKRRHKHNPNSSLGDFKFPGVMSSMALFNCVQVRSMDDTVNEIAYQTSVNIGGHVFSGLLYDQGPDQQNLNARDDPLDQQQYLNLRTASIHTHQGASATIPPLPTTSSQELFFPPTHPFTSASFRQI